MTESTAANDSDSHAAAEPDAIAQQDAEHFPDIADLSYEQARDQLIEVVRQLEAGGTELEASLALWERGEALANHCQRWLDGARKKLDTAIKARDAGSDAS